MKRSFLSLQIQDKQLEHIDPLTVTTWEPVSANSMLTRGITDNDEVISKVSDGNQMLGNTIMKTKHKIMKDEDEQEVMVLFPCQHRKEIIKPHHKKTADDKRRDYQYLELAIANKENPNQISLSLPQVSFIHKSNDEENVVLRVPNPTFVGSVCPRAASPSNSQENITFVPTMPLLNLKKPRSGVFVNELTTALPNPHINSKIDPRKVQDEMNAATKKFIVQTDPITEGMQALLSKPRRPKHELKHRGTEILNDQSSIVQASMSALDNVNAPQSLVIATLAYIYSKLENAKYWNGSKLDDIIRLGVVYHDKWMYPKDQPTPKVHQTSESKSNVLDVTTIPTSIDLHGFRVNIELTPAICRGEIMEKVPFFCSALNCGLMKCFKGTRTVSVIVEATNVSMVLWRSKGMYYMFNVFACDKSGKYTVDKGSACILMNNRLAELIEILDKNLSRSCQPKTAFVMHEIRVCDVDKIERNEYFNNDDVHPLMQKQMKQIELPSAAEPLVIPEVPLHELSDLSVCGGKKRKSKMQRSVDTSASKEALDRTQTVVVDKQADKMLIDVCEMTLESVLDKIEDKIELNCIDSAVPDGAKCARKVLIQSDLGHLQQERKKIHRGLDIDQCAEKKLDISTDLTLCQELLLDTNMRDMPDGAQILHGTQNLLQVIEYNASISVVAPVIAIVMSYKYSICSWDSAILDFVLNTTKYVQECVPFDQYQMFRGPRNHLPDIQVGEQRFGLHVFSLCICPAKDIGNKLSEHMCPPVGRDRVVVSSTVYSAAIFRRKNFWYLFDAYPCDTVGFRTKDMCKGTATLQRFMSFDGLLQRLRCNQQVTGDNQMFSVNRVQVNDVSRSAGLVKPLKFVERPSHQEAEIIERLTQEQAELVQRNNKRLEELNCLIMNEKCRINEFYKCTGKRDKKVTCDDGLQQVCIDPNRSTRVCCHCPDATTNASQQSLLAYELHLRQPFGYCCIEPEFFHKIQGSTCLPNRFRFRGDGIRACHCCSVYASLLAFNRKWAQWNFRVVDQCIEEGLNIYRHIETKENTDKRCIERILIDRSYYHICVERCQCLKEGATLLKTLELYFEKRQYVLLQFPNCTFAIIKRGCFNLFDPYNSNELREADDPMRMWPAQPSNVKITYCEKNTASWICMPTLRALLDYVEQRIRYRDMNTAFGLYHIKVINAYACPERNAFAQSMLTFSLRPNETRIDSFEALAQSVPDEEVRWLDAMESMMMVPWSRRLTHNLMDVQRYTQQARWKSFDCELNGELYSLWSHLHPDAALFDPQYRGRQFAGIYLIAGCMTAVYPLDEWNEQLMDYTVIVGDRYFARKMDSIETPEHEVELEDLCGKINLNAFRVCIDVKPVLFGSMYGGKQAPNFNLKKALLFFFRELSGRRFGVLQCFRKSLAFGRSEKGQYFMFDCMSRGAPLFLSWQGGAYLLMCNSLRRLLHCIVLTLRVPCYNVEFTIHSVNCEVSAKDMKKKKNKRKARCMKKG